MQLVTHTWVMGLKFYSHYYSESLSKSNSIPKGVYNYRLQGKPSDLSEA